MKIFISTTTFGEYDKKCLTKLKDNNIAYDLNPHKRKLAGEEITEFLKTGEYVGLIAGTEPLSKKVLESANNLKVISRLGVGLDNVDLKAADQLDIKVYNTPDVLTDSVSELTTGLILCTLRKIVQMDREMRAKNWRKQMGGLFAGKVLGLVGFGRIGQRVAELAKAFRAEVIFYDPIKIESDIAGQVSLDDLWKKSDIISFHSSAKDQLVGENEISMMKDGVILINTARGQHIDEDGLYENLKSGKVGAAGLDVYGQEPYEGKLCDLDNVVTTPHIGSYAKEARIKMEIEAVNNLIKGLKI